jgi:hypothetical protein
VYVDDEAEFESKETTAKALGGVSVRTVDRMVKSGDLILVPVSPRRMMVQVASRKAYVAKRRAAAEEAAAAKRKAG